MTHYAEPICWLVWLWWKKKCCFMLLMHRNCAEPTLRARGMLNGPISTWGPGCIKLYLSDFCWTTKAHMYSTIMSVLSWGNQKTIVPFDLWFKPRLSQCKNLNILSWFEGTTFSLQLDPNPFDDPEKRRQRLIIGEKEWFWHLEYIPDLSKVT